MRKKISYLFYVVLWCFMLSSCPPDPDPDPDPDPNPGPVPVVVDDLYIDELNSINAYVDDTPTQLTITIAVTPDTDENRAVNWTTGNEAIATVVDGLVTPIGAGTTQISVISVANESRRDFRKITVFPIEIDSISLDKTNHTILAYSGTDTVQLTATVVTDPVRDSIDGVLWSSSEEAVASVTEAGLVTGLTDGVTTITVTSTHDTSKSATCVITVESSEPLNMSVNTTALSSLSLTYWDLPELTSLYNEIGDSLAAKVKAKIESAVTFTNSGDYAGLATVTINTAPTVDGIVFNIADSTDNGTIDNLTLPVTIFANDALKNKFMFRRNILGGSVTDLGAGATILDSSTNTAEFDTVKAHAGDYSVVVVYKAPATLSLATSYPLFEAYKAADTGIHVYAYMFSESTNGSLGFEFNKEGKPNTAGWKFTGDPNTAHTEYSIVYFDVVADTKFIDLFGRGSTGNSSSTLFTTNKVNYGPNSLSTFYDAGTFETNLDQIAPTSIRFGGTNNLGYQPNYPTSAPFVDSSATIEFYFVGITNAGLSATDKTALTDYVKNTIILERK